MVAYDDGRLTLHAEKVPLADVVREIGRQSGAEIVGKVRKPREVTRQFDEVPLFDALVRLLGEQNFTLRYGSEGKLRTISGAARRALGAGSDAGTVARAR